LVTPLPSLYCSEERKKKKVYREGKRRGGKALLSVFYLEKSCREKSGKRKEGREGRRSNNVLNRFTSIGRAVDHEREKRGGEKKRRKTCCEAPARHAYIEGKGGGGKRDLPLPPRKGKGKKKKR